MKRVEGAYVPLLPGHESYEYGERPMAGSGPSVSVTVYPPRETRPVGFAPWPEPKVLKRWFLERDECP